VRRLVHPDAAPLIAPSQGIHLVFEGSFLSGGHAIMVPHTTDGRVMFAIPVARPHARRHDGYAHHRGDARAAPMEDEIEFIPGDGRTLSAAADRTCRRAERVRRHPAARAIRAGRNTGLAFARSHDSHRPVGFAHDRRGKWTTYRRMAEDGVDHAATLGRLAEKPCVTRNLNVHGFHRQAANFGPLALYGSDALLIEDLIRAEPALEKPLHPALPICGAEVVWAARAEMARTVEDVLARRTRALFLNARAAIDMAPETARLLARELNRDAAWQAQQVDAFRHLAGGYLVARRYDPCRGHE
jgi:glycerol-3-phosphate dehydrogenase